MQRPAATAVGAPSSQRRPLSVRASAVLCGALVALVLVLQLAGQLGPGGSSSGPAEAPGQPEDHGRPALPAVDDMYVPPPRANVGKAPHAPEATAGVEVVATSPPEDPALLEPSTDPTPGPPVIASGGQPAPPELVVTSSSSTAVEDPPRTEVLTPAALTEATAPATPEGRSNATAAIPPAVPTPTTTVALDGWLVSNYSSAGLCNSTINTPIFNATFWEEDASPAFSMFQDAHSGAAQRFVKALALVSKTTADDAAIAAAALFRQAVLTIATLADAGVRPNPHGGANLTLLTNFTPPFRRAYHRRRCFLGLKPKDLWTTVGRQCVDRSLAALWYQVDLERMLASTDPLDPYAPLPVRDPTYRPTVFIDAGARDYTRSLQCASKHSRQCHYKSSVRWFEDHYPGFLEMNVRAFEVDRRFAASYREFAARRVAAAARANVTAGGFRLDTVAVWAHYDGLSFNPSAMMSVGHSANCASTRGCICFPTVDFADVLAAYPPRSVTLKIDIEFGEWVMFEYLLRRGVLDRLGEVYLECHTMDAGEAHIFKTPDMGGRRHSLTPDQRWQLWRLIGHIGADCLLLHDFLRYHNITSHEWP